MYIDMYSVDKCIALCALVVHQEWKNTDEMYKMKRIERWIRILKNSMIKMLKSVCTLAGKPYLDVYPRQSSLRTSFPSSLIMSTKTLKIYISMWTLSQSILSIVYINLELLSLCAIPSVGKVQIEKQWKQQQQDGTYLKNPHH